mmetsp:Transcript_45049/g.133366  ORF Transcript_45049/g.133366 Transcript_45049/m.133366 type:complete len:215 (+) Transcript_45049:274-918(+)
MPSSGLNGHDHLAEIVEGDRLYDGHEGHPHAEDEGVRDVARYPRAISFLLHDREALLCLEEQRRAVLGLQEVDGCLHTAVDKALHLVLEALVLGLRDPGEVEELRGRRLEQLLSVAHGLLELHPVQLHRLLLVHDPLAVGAQHVGHPVAEAPVVVLDEEEEVAGAIVKLLRLLPPRDGRPHERIRQRPQTPEEGLVRPRTWHTDRLQGTLIPPS